MNFSWDQQTLDQVDEVIRFVHADLRDDVYDNDPDCRFPRENWEKSAAYGILGWAVPVELGGSGYDSLKTVRLLDVFGYACRDTGLTFAINSQMWSVQPAILKFGSPEQTRNYLPRLIRGECGAFGITEADTGSDTFSLKTTAKRVEEGYLLNGEKKLITLAPEANLAVAFASTNPQVGRWGTSAFIVERGTPGFTITPTQPKMGLRTTPIGDMSFQECFVPVDNRLGPEGAGSSIFTTAMNSERGFILASQLGAMQRQLEISVEYARSRHQFQQSISKYQAVSHRFAEMKMRLELSRLMLYKVAWMDTQGQPALMESSLAKLYLSEAAVSSSLDAIRTHGARGFLSEYEVERDLRDSIGGLIYSGTSDIQRNIIASLLGL